MAAGRTELLARQRDVADRVLSSWRPLSEKVEGWTAECAAEPFTEQPHEKLVAEWDFRALPGIYLRVGQEAARDERRLRAAAGKSLHDGFTSCLFLTESPSPVAGPECESAEECPRGTTCNELRHCAAPAQPYNLRVGYRAMHVLGDEWVATVQAVDSDLELRGATASFGAAEKYDLPLALELLAKARYFLVVVDEPAPKTAAGPGGAAASPGADAAGASDDRSIPSSAHEARVCMWRLEDSRKMFALRREASGQLFGGAKVRDAAALEARQRQANSCALALSVREAIGAPNTPAVRD